MLRIRFTGNDLARVRMSEAHPLWEAALSLRALRSRSQAGTLGDWRIKVRTRFPETARILLTLCPARGDLVSFLIPRKGACHWRSSVEAVQGTPRDRLHRDITVLGAGKRTPAEMLALAAGEPAARIELGRALRDYHSVAIAPYWERIQARIDAEKAHRLRGVAEGGLEHLLSTLVTPSNWNSGVYEINYEMDREIRLDGRGLVLAPSVFCGRRTVVVEDPEEPPVLFFPVSMAFTAPLHETETAFTGSLSALLGPTRAAVLAVAVGGITTTELARRLDVAPSTASEHVKVLRNAGLITTGRAGRHAVHTITPLGSELTRRREAG